MVDRHTRRSLIRTAAGRGCAASTLLPRPMTCGQRTPVVTLAAESHVLGRRKRGPGLDVVRVEAASQWRRWTCDYCRLTREQSCSPRRQRMSCPRRPAPHQTGPTRSVFTISVSSSTLQFVVMLYYFTVSINFKYKLFATCKMHARMTGID